MYQTSAEQLASIANQIKTLLSISFSTDGDDKYWVDEILYGKVKDLCIIANEFHSSPYSQSPSISFESITPFLRTSTFISEPEIIGNRIQIAREDLGMSLDALATAVIPDDVEVVSEWENGKSEPCASEIIRLSQALKCDPMWLLTGKECAK